jgi:alpha-tubulin suppressor-like RCC1 family protein
MAAIDVGQGRTVMSVSAGSSHTCAVLDDGTARCWGYNFYGQLGYGDTSHRGNYQGEMGASLSAIDVGEGRTVVSVSAGLWHT